MDGHVFEPVQVDLFDAPADVDGLIHTPTLVDVAHEVDIRTHRLADKARALHFAGCRRITG